MAHEPMTATEIKQNWARFDKLPEVVAANKAMNKVKNAIFLPLIKRAKQLLKEQEHGT